MDFSLFRQAVDPSQLDQPKLPARLDRAQLLAYHRRLVQQEHQLDTTAQRRTRRVVVGGPTKAWSSAKLESLANATLVGGAIKTDSTANGQVLVVRIVAEAVRTSGVNFVVEDREGAVAPIQVYNLQPSLTNKKLNAIYRLGSHWAIKEPTLRSSSRGYLIRVDSPSDLVRLWPTHPLLSPAFATPPPTPVIRHTAVEHKTEGNAWLARSQPLDALEHYSLGLDATDDPALRATLLSNRAAVYLRLGKPGRALRDCELAISQAEIPIALDAKLRFRAAQAAYEMERYPAAGRWLAEVAELAPGDVAADALRTRLAVRTAERFTGCYDWPALYAQAQSGAALDIASYAHPAIAVAAVAGKHRALVATASLEPGELLFVQRPLASGRSNKDALSLVAGVNLWTDCLDPPAVGEVVAQLAERWVDRGDGAEIAKLWAGEEMGWLEKSGDGEGVDITRLEAIATYNCFHPESLATAQLSGPQADEAESNMYAPSALYSLPSFMNHACIGNVSYSFLGDVIFARARLAIDAGAELVDSYVDGADDLDARRLKLGKHGFVCACELCGMDERDGSGLRGRRATLSQEVAGLTDEIHGAKGGSPVRHLDRIRALVDELEGCHHPARSRPRPAVYPARRLLAQSLADCGRAEDAIREEVEALRVLGAAFAGEELGALELVGVPRVGDTNAALSALFIAKQWQDVGRSDASRHWVGVARRIERGQAGEALFELRYGDWARRHNLTLEM